MAIIKIGTNSLLFRPPLDTIAFTVFTNIFELSDIFHSINRNPLLYKSYVLITMRTTTNKKDQIF